MNLLILAVAALSLSCQKPAPDTPSLGDPSSLKAEQLDLASVKLSWADNAEGEKGYRIFLRGEGDAYNVEPLTTVEPDASSFVFEGLASGKTYDMGVQALSEDMKKHSKTVFLNGFRVLGREELAEQDRASRAAAPSGLEAVQKNNSAVTLTWKDNASDEKGYNIYMREASAESFGEPVASLAADACTYEHDGLALGASYVFGVQAAAATIVDDSKIMTVGIALRDLDKIPEVTDIKTSYAYIAVSYKVRKLEGTNPEHGVCFSAEGIPTVDDIRVPGPEIKAGTEILQVVPNVYLEQDKDYTMCVYSRDGGGYIYSEPQSVKLEAQPAAVNLDWVKQDYEGTESVEIYKTTSQLDGRNFNAWYAVADPSKVDFRVLNTPTGKANLKTVAYQAENAEGECLVLINGGVFGNYHIGVIHTDGAQQEWVDFVYNKYWNPNGDGTYWNITRPIVGVDESGKAGAYWTSSPQYGTYYYYDRPLPTVPGEAGYAEASATNPVPAIDWKPFNAISTGPMLLYDGKCCVDHSKAPSGADMTNSECWALDIYEGRPDRTAVGVTEDGKIVLFICDGRIDASQGATHEEVAMIMKSIGCVNAMNLDGGGSTGMWVSGAGMINHKDGSWRAVKSTLGFFKK